MCKSFRSAPTFAHRSADYIRSCVKAFSLSQKPSTHLRIGKIPSGKQAFRGNFANPRFVVRNFKKITPNMGITIHFEGKLKDEEHYNLLRKKVIEYSEFHNWTFFEFQNELKKLERVKNEEDWDYVGATKGIQVQPHENSEPLIFEFDKDLYVQEYCKTQFSNIETHI